MATLKNRVATLHVEQGVGKRSVLTAYVPSKISTREFNIVQESLIGRIKDLTGCACLSGAIDVIFKEDFRDVLNVNLNG